MKKVSKLFICFSLLFFYAGSLHGAEYVAFSLKVAHERIVSTPKGKDFRKLHPEVFTLGGITKISGLVYDRKHEDVILIGQRDPDRSVLTLDDFVVALRARFIHGKWPVVSIDPTEETKKTNMQRVRFEGGIEDTQFGQDLFDADYRLKRIGMGLLPSGVPGLNTYWDLGMERARGRSGGSHKIRSRFWFYPVLPSVSVREDVVVIKGLKVGVFTEVLSAEIDEKKIEHLSTFQDQAGDMFAKEVSEKFENLARVHPSFSRLQGLDELVALTKAIEELDERPNLDWWLMEYQVKQVDTREELKVLKRREEYRVPVSGGYYEGYGEVSGGVQLMAIALRLKAGDVTALKEAVINTRPKLDVLIWSFLVKEWLVPASPVTLKMKDVGPLFAQAVFLQEQERYDDAITLYGKIIDLEPDLNEAYNNRGLAYCDMGQYDRAISDFDKAIEINPRNATPYCNRGLAFGKGKSQYDDAISDLNKAIEINAMCPGAYTNRGTAYFCKGKYDKAISDLNKAIEINPRDITAYANRGAVYEKKGQQDRAISDYNKALEIRPHVAKPWFNKGVLLMKLGSLDEALNCFERALEIDPQLSNAWYNKAVIFARLHQWDKSLTSSEHGIKADLTKPGCYVLKAIACEELGKQGEALSTYRAAMRIAVNDTAFDKELAAALDGISRLTGEPDLKKSYGKEWWIYEYKGY